MPNYVGLDFQGREQQLQSFIWFLVCQGLSTSRLYTQQRVHHSNSQFGQRYLSQGVNISGISHGCTESLAA